MAFDYNETFNRIIAKAGLLEERYNRMSARLEQAQARIEELEATMTTKDRRIESLEQQVEYLQMASTLTPSREQIDNVRSMITSLMRDIDRCITDLSD